MKTKTLYILIIGLIVFAFAVWGYNNFYAHIASSYFDLFYKTINFSVLILLLMALGRNKTRSFLKETLTQRSLPYESSIQDLHTADQHTKALKAEKHELTESFVKQKQEVIEKAHQDATSITKQIDQRIQNLAHEQQEKLKKIKLEYQTLAKLAVYDEVVKNFTHQAQQKKVLPSDEQLAKFFKALNKI